MKVYIRSSACISPQKTFGNADILSEVMEYNDTRLRAIEPDYSAYIDPKLIRRMSHIIKMGVAAARECLTRGNVEMPGAIITGTAFGCLEDTVSFLTRMIEMQEEMLPPTAFIQSTHNTVAAQVALMLKCHNYNNTFVHKGISFESALLDGMMLLKEKEADNVLVGGTDELTDASYAVLSRLGLYRRQPISNLSLFTTEAKGTIGGEGAVFVLLSGKQSEDNLAELNGLHTFYKSKDAVEIEQQINAFLERNGLKIEDIDLVITGRNGDIRNDEVYHQLSRSLFKDTVMANYKHLCGEYPTSPAFALWLAANVVSVDANTGGYVQAWTLERAGNRAPKKVLIYNHYLNIYHSLMLVSAC